MVCFRALAILLLCANLVGALASGFETFLISGDGVSLDIEREHGRLVRLCDSASGISLSVPVDKAENFRLLVPLDDDSGNMILGKDQILTEFAEQEHGASLKWDGPLTDQKGNSHAISVTLEIDLSQAGISFDLRMANHSSRVITEVSYPVLGDVLGLDGKEGSPKISANPPPFHQKSFSRPFGEHLASYPGLNMAFVDLFAEQHQRGLYFGAHDRVARYKLFRLFEQGEGEESVVSATLTHLPFTAPGQSFEGATAVFRFHDGDWVTAGKAFYRPWFLKTFGIKPRDEDWIREQGFFQMIMLMLPEGNINYRICDIPRLARDGLKRGIRTLQIAGWQRGGHDNGYPYYEPDPRLGTWEDLEKAIQECHRMGVKIDFFANITVVNLDTEWAKKELYRCGATSATGADYWIAGWGMGTLASRMGTTVPLMSFSDPGFPAMHDGHLKYFKKLASIGADGLHIDKMFPAQMNFNSDAMLSPDQSTWEGALRLIKDIHDGCRALHPGFSMSFECNWDRLLQYGTATWWAGNMTSAKRVFPELVETLGLYEPYDALGLNNAVRNGYAVMLSPLHFNRSMSTATWAVGLSGYIAELQRARSQVQEAVFFGEPLPDSQGLRIVDRPSGSSLSVKTYQSLDADSWAAVVTNDSLDEVTIQVSGAGQDRSGTLYQPGRKPKAVLFPAAVKIPGERLVFVASGGHSQ